MISVAVSSNTVAKCCSVCCVQDAHEMFHVMTETVAEEMMPASRPLTLFDVARLEVCTVHQRVSWSSSIMDVHKSTVKINPSLPLSSFVCNGP